MSAGSGFRPPLLLRAAGATLSGLWTISDRVRRPAVLAERDRMIPLSALVSTLTSADSGIIRSPRPRTKSFSTSSGTLRPPASVCTITSYCSASRL